MPPGAAPDGRVLATCEEAAVGSALQTGRDLLAAALWVVLVRDKKTLGGLDTPPEARQFREPVAVKGVPVWTDAQPDVWVLWPHPELQALRKLLGLPTPIEPW